MAIAIAELGGKRIVQPIGTAKLLPVTEQTTNFEELAHWQTIEGKHTMLHFMQPAPLFREDTRAGHTLVIIEDKKTYERFAADIITTGGYDTFSPTSPGMGNPVLRRFDTLRNRIFGDQDSSFPTVKVLTESEGVRLLNDTHQEDFEKRLDLSVPSKTIILRSAIRLGPNDNQVLSPDTAPSAKIKERGLTDLSRAINSPIEPERIRKLSLPDTQKRLEKTAILGLPGGYTVFAPTEIIHQERQMYLYPVTMSRVGKSGEVAKEYFEMLTTAPLEELRQEDKLVVGVESYCSCMTSGQKGCDCHAQVRERVKSVLFGAKQQGIHGVVLYAPLETDLQDGEVSRAILDIIRNNEGKPLFDTEVAREFSGYHDLEDQRNHNFLARLARNAFPNITTVFVPTANKRKLKAFQEEFNDIVVERIPAPHDPSRMTREVMTQAAVRRNRLGEKYFPD